MQRFIRVKPSYGMGYVSEENYDPNSGAPPPLGINKNSLFSQGIPQEKKFKIRLISKKTGKKADINIRFKHEHLKINPE